VQAVDAREVPCCGVIKDLQICLLAAPKKMLVMDVLVIDAPTQWGMLLSRQWVVDVGGSMQMDLSYADIPTSQVEKVRLYREHEMLHNVEDPRVRDNDYLYLDIKDPEAQETDMGAYMLSEILEVSMPFVPESEIEHSQVWSMTFDGASSRQGSSAGVVINAPSGIIFPFSSRLEFDCTNNMAKYEALLFGLRKDRKMGIKTLQVEDDSELILNQVRIKCEAWNQQLKRYRHVVWDETKYLDSFYISHIDRTLNEMVDSLAIVATLFTPWMTNPYITHLVEVSFHPFVPDNIASIVYTLDD
jgi:ribonuclease HI